MKFSYFVKDERIFSKIYKSDETLMCWGSKMGMNRNFYSHERNGTSKKQRSTGKSALTHYFAVFAMLHRKSGTTRLKFI